MKKQTTKELEALAKTYINARDKLLDIIINYKGVGTKTYYNTVLKNLTAEIKRLEAETDKYIGSAIPREYEQSLKDTYNYFKRNNLTMKHPTAFAQIHNDAIHSLAREMQFHIGQGLEQVGRQVLRYLDESMDNSLRKIGLDATAEKLAMGATVKDMQKSLIEKLQNEGFMTVQYGSGKKAYQVAVEDYAAMVARSTTREAGNLARENQLIENGYDLVEMTTHYPTCEKCAMFQGRVYSLSGKDKRFPALMQTAFKSGYRNVHPNCRHSIVPFIEDLQTDKEIQQAIANSNKPFKDSRSDAEKGLYSKQQAQNRQMRQDRYQYERYKARLGEEAPKSFHSFRKMKKDGGVAWEDLRGKYREIGKTVVDWEKINSEDWKNKFKGLTTSEKVDDRLRDLSVQILKHRQGTFYEDMYVIDLNTGELKGFQTESKTKFQVDANESLKNAFENSKANSLIGIHNHPLSSIPSLGDLNAIASCSSMKQGIIVCHDGTVFSYTRPKAFITQQDYEYCLTKYKRYSKITMEDKGFQDLCEDYKFEFRRIE